MKRNKEQQIVFQRKEADESIERSRLTRTLSSPILQRWSSLVALAFRWSSPMTGSCCFSRACTGIWPTGTCTCTRSKTTGGSDNPRLFNVGGSKVTRFDVKGVIHKSNMFYFGGRAKKSGVDKNPLFFGKVNLYTGLYLQKDLGFPNNVFVEVVTIGNNIVSRLPP